MKLQFTAGLSTHFKLEGGCHPASYAKYRPHHLYYFSAVFLVIVVVVATDTLKEKSRAKPLEGY